MTFLSVCLGYATMIIPREVTFYACTALLALFGLKMLYEGWKMSPDEGLEEYEEVSAELRKREEMVRQRRSHTALCTHRIRCSFRLALYPGLPSQLFFHGCEKKL